LVQGIFSFIICPEIGISSPGPSYCIYLIDKDKSRSSPFGFIK